FPVPARSAYGEPIVRRHLVIDAREDALLAVLVRNGEALAGQRRGRREDRAGLAFIFIRHEVVRAVLDDRTAEGAAELLVLVRQNTVRDRILGVEAVVAEEAVNRARHLVGPRARDRLHLDAGRPPLRDVEHVRDNLEFGDRLAAELRLAEAGAGDLLRNLLAVEVQLKVVVAADAGRVADVVRRDALDQL